MKFNFQQFFTLLAFSAIFNLSSYGQENFACSKNDRQKIREYFAGFNTQNKLISVHNEQLKQFKLQNPPQTPFTLAGNCEWSNNGCPVQLVVPKYPKLAKEFRFQGAIDVEIITDETGKVFYSKAISGKSFFTSESIRAACQSTFSPWQVGNKIFKIRKIIRYNFIL